MNVSDVIIRVERADSRPEIFGFATACAGMTLLLILAGGFVTTTATGDTIPTWPHWWGRLSGGMWVEWTHRAVAGTLGLMVLALALVLQKMESRPWVRRLGWMAFTAVVIQALLGGVRVYLFIPKATAIVHATLAQLIFCAMTAAAFIQTRVWREAVEDDEVASARKLAVATTVTAFLQLVAGAVTRHTGAGVLVHLMGAGVVLLFGSLLGSRLVLTPVKRGAFWLLSLLGIQVALGVVALGVTQAGFVRSVDASVFKIALISVHVAVGALVLAASLLLALRCHRAVPKAGPA